MPRRSGTTKLQRVLEPEYTVLEEIARGATSVVYLAHDNVLDRQVAVKVLQPRLRRSRAAVARFVQRAQVLARLQHAQVAGILEVRRLNAGPPALVMRYVSGEPLADLLERDGSLPPRRAEQAVRDIGGALEAAHSEGIVHGSLDADHVIIEAENGTAVLLGFGSIAGGDGEGSEPELPEQMIQATLERQKDRCHLALLGWKLMGNDEGTAFGGHPPTNPFAARLWQVLNPTAEGRFSDVPVETGAFVEYLCDGPPPWTQRLPVPAVVREGLASLAVPRFRRVPAAGAVMAAATVLLGAGAALLAAPHPGTPSPDVTMFSADASPPGAAIPLRARASHLLPVVRVEPHPHAPAIPSGFPTATPAANEQPADRIPEVADADPDV